MKCIYGKLKMSKTEGSMLNSGYGRSSSLGLEHARLLRTHEGVSILFEKQWEAIGEFERRCYVLWLLAEEMIKGD